MEQVGGVWGAEGVVWSRCVCAGGGCRGQGSVEGSIGLAGSVGWDRTEDRTQHGADAKGCLVHGDWEVVHVSREVPDPAWRAPE